MNLKIKQMGDYQTNCYIITINNKDFIIDPGVGATNWVIQNTTNPIAILNTHGHFDHVWSNNELKNKLNVKIYCPKDDVFMLTDDIYNIGLPTSNPDVYVEPNQEFDFDEVKIKFHHFAGHTPGCSAIEIQNNLFSGDFIFSGTIGRVDFPYSSSIDMKKSIEKILSWNNDIVIYPGHGEKTTLFKEKLSLEKWLNYL